MSGHISIKEVHHPIRGLKYIWRIYAGNFRLVAGSDRTYNTVQHARDAAKRFQKVVSAATMRSDIVRVK